MRPTSSPRGVALRQQPWTGRKRAKLRTVVTVVAALAILGGLVRLAIDDQVAPVALPEPQAPGQQAQPADDARAPLLSGAISALAVGDESAR